MNESDLLFSANRLGLRKVIDAASSLHKARSPELFAQAVLSQISAILESEVHGILCTQRRLDQPGEMTMLAGSGRFRGWSGAPEELPRDAALRSAIQAALDRQSHQFRNAHAALYLKTPTQREVVVYVECGRAFSERDFTLLEMFGQSISIGYDNLELCRQLQATSATLERRVNERTQALTRSETHLKQFKAAVQHSSASIFITDQNATIIYANPSVARTSGYALREILGQHADLFRSNVTPGTVYREMWEQLTRGRSWRGELLNRRKDEVLHWEDVSISPVTDNNGVITNYIVVKDEISERKMMEAELRHLAMIDPLTGLLNRRSFFALAEEEVVRRHRVPGPLSALMLDVDHFKSINDTHGHQGGDEVLRALAATCAACMRDRYFMGRLGGEEFACILPDTSLEQAMLIAERLRREVALKRIYLEEDAQVAITVSIGVATFHKTDSSIDTVLHRADHALYAAKQAGRDCIRSEG